MTEFDEILRLSDPDLHEHLNDCIDKFEIRGSETAVVKDWIGRALVAESILGLMRKKMINVVGIKIVGDEIEPLFKQNLSEENYENENTNPEN